MENAPRETNGFGHRATLVVTNTIKLAGVALVFQHVLTVPTPAGVDPFVLAVAAFMMAGAQGIESFFANFFGGKK